MSGSLEIFYTSLKKHATPEMFLYQSYEKWFSPSQATLLCRENSSEFSLLFPETFHKNGKTMLSAPGVPKRILEREKTSSIDTVCLKRVFYNPFSFS
ncbi:MAG: hypothetical protein WA082_01265, partial [Candidatus Moraniibacteriota bacterium]